MNQRSIVSVENMTRDEIMGLLEDAAAFEKTPNSGLLEGKIVATLFFEPSTRTRLSFETAVLRLGGRVIGFSDPAATSTSKGESLHDTVRIVSNYADLIVMRHYREGAPAYAASITDTPVINAGDGSNQHPSQTMLDLYSIYKTQGTLDGLEITMVGDLKYGRTVHSLLMAMRHFSPRFNFVADPRLGMPEEFIRVCEECGIPYTVSAEFSKDIIDRSDIIYMTRVQRERFDDLEVYEKVKDLYSITPAMIRDSKPTMKILHPLPRLKEIPEEVDDCPQAYYFEQARNGVFARQAMICKAMGINPPR